MCWIKEPIHHFVMVFKAGSFQVNEKQVPQLHFFGCNQNTTIPHLNFLGGKFKVGEKENAAYKINK